jgi:hypothetical protein
MRKSFLLAILLNAVFSVSFASESIRYDQDIALSGKLQLFQGETPDEEIVYFPGLLLSEPITVNGINDEVNSETEKGVILIQLVLSEQLMRKFSTLEGKNAVVDCRLFHSITGYHYTNVLCDTLKIESL